MPAGRVADDHKAQPPPRRCSAPPHRAGLSERSMPASRAASARLTPSRAWAMANIRAATRPLFSRRARARSSLALRSSRIGNAAGIRSSPSWTEKRITDRRPWESLSESASPFAGITETLPMTGGSVLSFGQAKLVRPSGSGDQLNQLKAPPPIRFMQKPQSTIRLTQSHKWLLARALVQTLGCAPTPIQIQNRHQRFRAVTTRPNGRWNARRTRCGTGCGPRCRPACDTTAAPSAPP